jgi:hypothetical protein
LRLDEHRGADGAVSLTVSSAGMSNARRACTDANTYGARALTDRPLRSEILPHNPLKKNHMRGCSAFCTLPIREKPCQVCSELIMG